MAVKLFILGLPGSGKSALARYISRHLSDWNWRVTRFNDYYILKGMFLEEKLHEDKQRRFQEVEPDGFDVLDFRVNDEALRKLEQEVKKFAPSLKSERQELVLIEFARNSYRDAFALFENGLFQDAYFLYLNAEVVVCKQRIQARVAHPDFPEDDHPVSDYIFETYYNHDDGQNLVQILEQHHQVDTQRILSFDNNGSYEQACEHVQSFIQTILQPLSVVNK